MDVDLLLAWMTHIGESSWARFRSAAEELSGRDTDLPVLCRKLRIGLSDLGFADFFVHSTQQWRVLPPVLGGISEQDTAVLSGSRTPTLIESLKVLAAMHDCKICMEKPQGHPTLIHVVGSMDHLVEVADQIGVSFEPNLSVALTRVLTPIPARLKNAPQEPAPLNWEVRSFDFKSATWVDELLPNSACEFTPTYGRPKYFIHRKRGRLLRISKRESLYAAAMLNGIRLIEYDASDRRLKVPLFAPLPELYSRAACLCSGRPADVKNGRITYGRVPPDLAAVVTVAAGQPHPGVEIQAATRS